MNDEIVKGMIEGEIMYKLMNNQELGPFERALASKSEAIIKFAKANNLSIIEMKLSTYEKVCDCGAKHTSFPQHHYHWCGMKQ